MNWITDRIAIGNCFDAQSKALLTLHGFRSALSLDGALSVWQPSELGLAEIAVVQMVDGPGNDLATYRRAVETLARLVESHPPTLVQCHAGRSRSPIVVAGYLVRTRDLDPVQAIGEVAAKRDINISDGLEHLLHRYWWDVREEGTH